LLSDSGDISSGDVPLGEINSIIQENVHQLVIKLDCEVNVKDHETTLLILKEKQTEVFDSVELYNKAMLVMRTYRNRLVARRFVQELFQDVKFTQVYAEANDALKKFTELIDKPS